MRHENNGACPRCEQIFARYPGFHDGLKQWFKDLQKAHPEAHISCAGRGEQDQEDAKRKGASRASWLGSAHNYNAAIDVFEQGGLLSEIYEREWFKKVIAPRITADFEWYGAPGAAFPELPHIQVKAWQRLAKAGQLKPVE